MVKGDRRILVKCSEIEKIVYENHSMPQESLIQDDLLHQNEAWKSVDMEDNLTDDLSEEPVLSTGQEAEAAIAKRKAGQKQANHRELVRQAARRAVVFGLAVAVRRQAPSRSEPKLDHSSVRSCYQRFGGRAQLCQRRLGC